MKFNFALAGFLLAWVALNTTSARDDDKKTEAVKSLFKATDPAFKTDNKDLKATVAFEKDGKLLLANRGMVVSKKEYETGVQIRMKWNWESADTAQYADALAIVLRTDGKRRTRPYEVESGLVVRLSGHNSGMVYVEKWTAGNDHETLAKKEVDLTSGGPYSLEVTDDGDKIVVKVGGKTVITQKVDKNDGSEKRFIALYNREPVASVRKVSTVTDLTIEALPKKK